MHHMLVNGSLESETRTKVQALRSGTNRIFTHLHIYKTRELAKTASQHAGYYKVHTVYSITEEELKARKCIG